MFRVTRPSGGPSPQCCVLKDYQNQDSSRPGAGHSSLVRLGTVLLAMIIAGCSAAHYRRTADRDVYGIIQQTEAQIFGRTNTFTINTPYSDRKPSEIRPGELISNRLEHAELRLTLDEVLALAVTNSRTYQTQKEQLYLTALTLTGQRQEFSPNFFGVLDGGVSRNSNGESFSTGGAQFGVAQLLKTGGSLGLTLANDFLRYYTGDPRQSVVSVISVNIAQPLLRGLGKNNPAVEALTQAERNVVYALRSYSFFQNQFALEIVRDYFGLLAQKEIIRNRYTNYLGRVQSTERLEARAMDRERLADVDTARQAQLTSENNYINALALYKNTLDEFKIKLGLTIGDDLALDDDELRAVEQVGLVPVSLDPIAAYQLGVKQYLPLLNDIDQFEDSQRDVRIAADRLRPGLDIFADVSLDSERPTDYLNFNPNDYQAGVGIELDLPLNRVRERNNYRASLIAFESELRSLTLALDQLREEINRGMRTLEQRRQNYEIQKNALALANRRVESTELLLQAGRAEVRDLVDAQDSQIASQNAVTVALVDYQEVRLQLMLNLGILNTSQSQFWLRDHLTDYLPAVPMTNIFISATNQPVPAPAVFFKE
ncbi:MAG: TolC family protein [Verrucomicrobia bacterium]|nr:TolC family protein [Verrucomicrobiota bacterium]